MFHFLIVEDNEDLLDELIRAFAKWFPSSRIDSAVAVEDGLRLIGETNSTGASYDAAVLDFKLPRQKGLNDEIDETLCQEIKKTGYPTLVIHITGYGEDAKVLKHLEDFHQGSKLPWALVKKGGKEMWSDLERKAKSLLHGALITQQMEALFPQATPGEARLAAYNRPSNQGRSITMELADLFREITIHWDDLDEELKCKIRETFNVDISCTPIRISLLG